MPSFFQRVAKLFHKPTQEEMDQRALDRRQCPDCGSKHLLVGPAGGAGFDCACADCGSEFVLVDMFGRLALMQRLGKLTPDRAKFYGIDPPEPNAKLIELMKSEPPWDKTV